MNRAAVIGLGPSPPDISDAQVLAGGKRQLACFPEHPAERIVIADDVAASVDAIRRAVEAGKRVVVLASGDPLLYGIGATLARDLGSDRLTVHPAPSAVQLAFASVADRWHDATILSAHGRPLAAIVPEALAATKLAILTDQTATPSKIASMLRDAGLEDCRAVVCERLGEPGERIVESTLYGLAGHDFDPLNVLLLFRQPSDVRLKFGRPDELFESVRGQITKAEVRAVALSKLRLAPAGVLWDIGAGSGALAIEAALLMPRGAVYAIERDAQQRACLERNVARHAATNVRIVAGDAPEVLAGLPAPDSVFLGGSGGRLPEILEVLRPPFVANLAVLEHVNVLLDRFPEAEMTQLAVARSARIAGGHRLTALNPVYIVAVPA